MSEKNTDKFIPNKPSHFHLKDVDDFCLSEIDFYPPSDSRVLKSFIEDIDDGYNYADYCRDFFELLDEEDYYE